MNGEFDRLKLTLEVQHGIVEDIKISLPKNFAPKDASQDASVITNLRGTRYNHEITERIITAMGGKTVTLDAAKNVNKSNVAVNLWPHANENTKSNSKTDLAWIHV